MVQATTQEEAMRPISTKKQRQLAVILGGIAGVLMASNLMSWYWGGPLILIPLVGVWIFNWHRTGY